MRLSRRFSLWGGLAASLCGSTAFAQAPPTVTGAPPPDEAAAVAAVKASAPVPDVYKPVPDAMHVAISAGGNFQTGNSHLWAFTGQGKYDVRRGNNAFAASLIGNYARSEAIDTTGAPSGVWADSTNNVQGKIRFDRFLTDDASLYLQLTGTHDNFQALTFRANIDPGFKYLFVAMASTKLWGELGYDFQYDLHYTDSNDLERAGAGGNVNDANGFPYLISQSDTIESSRLFVGFYQAFNKEVSLSSGLEYLQGFGGSGGNPPAVPGGYTSCAAPLPAGSTAMCVDPVTISLKSARINFDALLAASVGGGFSFGFGYSLKYNGAPLPGKVDVDMSGTLNVIYAHASPAPATAPPPAPCPPPPPPPPGPAPAPETTPAPATIPPAPAPATMPPPAPAPVTVPPTASL